MPAQLDWRCLWMSADRLAWMRGQVGDLRPLRGDVLLELGLAGARVAQLVTVDARRVRGRADHADEEREEEKEDAEAAAEATTPGRVSGDRGSSRSRANGPHRSVRAALLQGDVIVRANSDGRPGSRRAARAGPGSVERRRPPVDRRPEWARLRTTPARGHDTRRV